MTVNVIDTLHLGRDRVIAAHEVRGELIVDPGPESCLETLVAGFSGEPRALLLTHIHLDHAGATGALVRRFPDLRVYVSEVGAPHVIDPSKLLKSAGRLYGEENMARLWGEVLPVPEANVIALKGGETGVEGFRIEHVPGHASHHLCWFDEATGDAYVGDMAGVRTPPSEFTIPPTPPPEVDVEAWLDSVDRIEALEPTTLRLTHFGAVEEVGAQLDRVREALRRNTELAKRGREAFLERFEADIDANEDPETATRTRQATPPEQQWLGLERYLRKRAEAADEGG
jgi:glyoxylase-like metal-dependent hydrolase (beta-lactamase superfamily II)